MDLATRWVAPEAGSYVEDAFRLYLDYDGHGSKIADDSIRTVSSDVNAVGACAMAGTGRRLFGVESASEMPHDDALRHF